MNLYEITYRINYDQAGTAIVRASSESEAVHLLGRSRPTYNFDSVEVNLIPESQVGVLFDDEGGY